MANIKTIQIFSEMLKICVYSNLILLGIKILGPHLWVPSLEPSGEGRDLFPLLKDGDGGTTAARGV